MSGVSPYKDQSYLGDGVYVCHDGYQLWVRANNADWGRAGSAGPADIALEPGVLKGLIAYARIVGVIGKEPL